jgi:nitrile hydratase accessory protein
LSPPDLPGLPRDAEGAPVFPEPWAARAFALAVSLSERGAFPWPEFSATLAAARAADPDGDYFAAWLHALESVLATRGIATSDAVAELAEAWQRAARATPHGSPIRLGA